MEHTQPQRAETALDDRHESAPDGGFKAVESVEDSIEPSESPNAAMPPSSPPRTTEPNVERSEPPHDSPAHPTGAFERIGDADDDWPTGDDLGFPPLPVAGFAPELAAPPASHLAPAASSSDAGIAPSTSRATEMSPSMIFFGEGQGEGSATLSSWLPEGDADLVLPIEPSRLSSAPATSQPDIDPRPTIGMLPPSTLDDTSEASNAGATGAPDDEGDSSSSHEVEIGAKTETGDEATDIAGWRISRSLARPMALIAAFAADPEATLTTFSPPTGSFVILAASELDHVMSSGSSDDLSFDGSSIELAPPEHVPLGFRVPLRLVSVRASGDTAAQPLDTELGAITASVAEGVLTLGIDLDQRVERHVVETVKVWLNLLAEDCNRRFEGHGRRLKALTVDSLGAVRVETEQA